MCPRFEERTASYSNWQTVVRGSVTLSFPKIISARSDDAIQTEFEWQRASPILDSSQQRLNRAANQLAASPHEERLSKLEHLFGGMSPRSITFIVFGGAT
jgi:hypothetical protein